MNDFLLAFLVGFLLAASPGIVLYVVGAIWGGPFSDKGWGWGWLMEEYRRERRDRQEAA